MASTILTDNFNSYTDGDLNGQTGGTPSGTWSGDVDLDIQGTTYFNDGGTKAVQLAAVVEKYCSKTGTLTNDGQLVIYVNRTTDSNGVLSITLFEGASVRINCKCETDETLYTYYSGVWNSTGLTFSENVWFYIKIEWRSSDHTARFSIDGGTPTGWLATQGTWVNGIDTVRIGSNAGTAGTLYFDYIAEESYTPPTAAAGHNFTTLLGVT